MNLDEAVGVFTEARAYADERARPGFASTREVKRGGRTNR